MIPRTFTKWEKLAGQMDRLPFGYRVAYYDHVRGRFVCYPIGLHWLARLRRRLWERSFDYNFSEFEQVMLLQRKLLQHAFERRPGQVEAAWLECCSAIMLYRDLPSGRREQALEKVRASERKYNDLVRKGQRVC